MDCNSSVSGYGGQSAVTACIDAAGKLPLTGLDLPLLLAGALGLIILGLILYLGTRKR